jgi:hypothetical protein
MLAFNHELSRHCHVLHEKVADDGERHVPIEAIYDRLARDGKIVICHHLPHHYAVLNII